jgi:hypothetical protein
VRSIAWPALAALALALTLVSPVAAEKPRPPDYERLAFEGQPLPLPPLEPAIVAAARADLAALPLWIAADRGGFRQLQAGAVFSPTAPIEPRHPGARALIGAAATPEISRLVPQFNGEPSAFGLVPGVQIRASLTPAWTTPPNPPTPGPGALPTPTTSGPRPLDLAPSGLLPSIPIPEPSAIRAEPTTIFEPSITPAELPVTTPVPTQKPMVPVLAALPTPAPVPTGQPTFAHMPDEPPADAPNPSATPTSSLILTIDPPGPIVHGTNMEPGGSVSGTVTLGNAGTLPFVYSMKVQGGSGPLWDDHERGLQLLVLRLSDNALLYNGPLAAATGPLGSLSPGERTMLTLRVSLPPTAGNAMQGTSVTVGFVFTAVPLP